MATQYIHQLDNDAEFSRDRLIATGKATNGKLYKITIGDLIDFIEGKDTAIVEEDYDYVLSDGYMIEKILVKATDTPTLKIGTSDGGEEVMLEDDLEAGVWKEINNTVIADGGDQTIYFTGITDVTSIIIYKKKL